LRSPLRPAALLAAALLATSLFALSACGKKKTKAAVKPSALSLSLDPAGKAAKFTVPATAQGGLVTLSFKNNVGGGAPHAAQLIRIVGSHTPQEALKNLASNSNKTPDWMRAEGGVGPVAPNTAGTATLDLPAGKYVVADVGGPGASGPPAYAPFTVTAGPTGPLPSYPTTVKAAETGKDKYAWQLSGVPLTAAPNAIQFVSGGKKALHFVGFFKVKGNPSIATIIKGLKSNGPPPPFVDQNSFFNTAVLDGGKAENTQLVARSGPGRYVLFCPLTDRDGGKPHFEEGLLKTVQVK
jgi:hypothetical protein